MFLQFETSKWSKVLVSITLLRPFSRGGDINIFQLFPSMGLQEHASSTLRKTFLVIVGK